MCVVSMMGDEFTKRWQPYVQPPIDVQPKPLTTEDWQKLFNPPPTKAEFDALKREVELLRDLLKAAKVYDEKNNEPHCEMENKVALIKAIAKAMGVDLSEVFK